MLEWKKPIGAPQVIPRKPPATQQNGRVTAAELAHLPEALRILSVLNNQFASAQDLAPSVEKMPALVARVNRAYQTLYINRALPTLPQQLGGLGNRRFEELLFKYLEDLTMLKAEMPE
jgi:hypothetical protein